MIRQTLITSVLLLLFAGCRLVTRAQKTDSVFENGDTITGEIKSMKLGLLTYDVTGPGIIDIKWEEVTKIKSDKIFEFTLVGEYWW
jgi:hypothetical protein